MYEKAWGLFRETQHMQPDRDAIETHLMKKLDLEKNAVQLVPVSSTANVYPSRYAQDANAGGGGGAHGGIRRRGGDGQR